MNNTSGFVYYVSITGITGAGSAPADLIAPAVTRIRAQADLPVAVGFGIRTPESAAAIAQVADAAVVGSAIVDRIAENLDEAGRPRAGITDTVLSFVSELAQGVRQARQE